MFEVGQIYRKREQGGSFYVEVVEVGFDYVVTYCDIDQPGFKKYLTIKKGGNWDYNISVMKYVGSKKEHGDLLLNQSIKIDGI